MWAIGSRKAKAAPVPVLDLSGPKLRRAFENLVESAEDTGGVERYVGALALKASLFEEVLGKGQVSELTEPEFYDLAAFITPVRRRIGAWLGCNGFAAMRGRLVTLLHGWADLGTTDQRLNAFVASFPADREHRWSRDLAAEVLHFTAPDRYPLMTRWMWDSRVNTGVLREIWHSDNNVDAGTMLWATALPPSRSCARNWKGFFRRTACSVTWRSTPICSAPTSMPPTSTTGAANICTRISAAAPRPTRWRIRAASWDLTRSIPNPAVPASS